MATSVLYMSKQGTLHSMKSAEPTEASPYASALARVMTLRAAPHSTHAQRPVLIEYLRQKIQQARIRLHLPSLQDEYVPALKNQDTARAASILLFCVPIIIFALILMMLGHYVPLTRPEVMTVSPPIPTQVMTFTVPWAEKTLSDTTAIEHAWKFMAENGYHPANWQMLQFPAMGQNQTVSELSFKRIDEKSGYCLFQNTVFSTRLMKVLISQKGNTVKTGIYQD